MSMYKVGDEICLHAEGILVHMSDLARCLSLSKTNHGQADLITGHCACIRCLEALLSSILTIELFHPCGLPVGNQPDAHLICKWFVKGLLLFCTQLVLIPEPLG